MGFCIYRVLWCPLQQAMWVFVIAAAAQSASGSGKLVHFIVEHTHCSNFESYWVRYYGEMGNVLANNPTDPLGGGAVCVPTAAGNLITHLAAKKNGKLEAYPFNYALDYWATDKAGQFLNNNPLYEYPLYEPTFKLPTFPNLDEQPTDKYYLGGQWFAPGDDQQDYSLIHTMKTDVTKGTRLDDARTGLQQYLDKTNRLGQATVYQIIRSSTLSDFVFLQHNPPYMLHINQTCLELDNYKYTDNNIATLMYRQPSPPSFYGSTMGHTIVVYNVESGTVPITGIKRLKLSGASGLKSSRNTTRGCDNTDTFVYDNQKVRRWHNLHCNAHAFAHIVADAVAGSKSNAFAHIVADAVAGSKSNAFAFVTVAAVAAVTVTVAADTVAAQNK